MIINLHFSKGGGYRFAQKKLGGVIIIRVAEKVKSSPPPLINTERSLRASPLVYNSQKNIGNKGFRNRNRTECKKILKVLKECV